MEGRIRGLHELVQEHDRAVWRRDNLPTVYLEEAWQVLAQHLQKADEGLLATWAAGDRSVLVHLKRLSGLAAKREFMTEMARGWARPTAEALRGTQGKFRAKAAKLARPKKWGLEVPVPPDFDQRLDAQAARRRKARDTIARMRKFDDYDRFDLAQPPETWWLHFHGGRRPGVFTPTLRGWYDRRPDVVVIADVDPAADLVLTAGRALGSMGDVS